MSNREFKNEKTSSEFTDDILDTVREEENNISEEYRLTMLKEALKEQKMLRKEKIAAKKKAKRNGEYTEEDYQRDKAILEAILNQKTDR